MSLSELAKKDNLWRQMAYSICGDKNDANDLVQEMYLRRYENDRGQTCTDAYIYQTLKSIFLNGKAKQRFFPQEEIHKGVTDDLFELNDEDKKYIDRAKKLSFAERELLELSYDYSLRELSERFKVNYLYAFRMTKQARIKVLGSEINKYKNKREKKMANPKSALKDDAYYNSLDKRSVEYKTWIAGRESVKLGDIVDKLTTVTGIKKIVKIVVGKDCGCEERKKKLNELFRFSEKIKCLEPQHIDEYKNFLETRQIKLLGGGQASGKLTPSEINFVCTMFSEIFNREFWQPTCTSCSGTAKTLIAMIYKLDTVYFNTVIEE